MMAGKWFFQIFKEFYNKMIDGFISKIFDLFITSKEHLEDCISNMVQAKTIIMSHVIEIFNSYNYFQSIFDILQINPEYVQFVVIFLNISIYIAPKISKELINCGVFDLIYRLSEIKDNQESMIFKFLGNISIYWFIDSFDFNR